MPGFIVSGSTKNQETTYRLSRFEVDDYYNRVYCSCQFKTL